MRTLERRIARLQERWKEARTPAVRLYWDGQIATCSLHPDCVIELATGNHLSGVVRLSFDGGSRE